MVQVTYTCDIGNDYYDVGGKEEVTTECDVITGQWTDPDIECIKGESSFNSSLLIVELLVVYKWRAGPTDRSLDSGSGGSSRGGSIPGLGTNNIYGMLYVSHPHEGDPKSVVPSLKYGGLLIKSAASRYQTPLKKVV